MPISPEEREFFEEFYREYKDFMFYITRIYTKEPGECDDIVQDVVIRLLRNIPSLRELNPPQQRKYISLTVKAAYMDSLKAKQDVLSLDDEILRYLAEKEQEAAPNLSPREEVDRLRQELAPREWLALEGKYILGYSQDELGTLLGIAPNSVRMLLCRVREKSRRILHGGSLTGGGRK